MAERKRQTTRRTATSRRSGSKAGRPESLGRLSESIEASQAALKDLRSEMSRGSRALLKDLDKTLRDASTNLRRTSRRIAKDLDEVQQAARGKRATTAQKKTTSRGPTSRRSTSRRTTSRRSTGRSGSKQ
jgi:hypothetical protein